MAGALTQLPNDGFEPEGEGTAVVPVRRGRAFAVIALLLAVALVASAWPRGIDTPVGSSTVSAAEGEVRILGGGASTLDPVAAGDAGSSAVISQLFETLTAIDPSLTVRPALAERWEVLDDGRRIIFHLRPNLRFSDGNSLDAADVVRSWLRVIDPDAPSPLVSLMFDVRGAREYLAGDGEADEVGVRADGNRVEVDLVRPAGEFPSVVASPTFAVVPEGYEGTPDDQDATDFVGSGGYVLAAASATELTLEANEHYWAGQPAIQTARLISDLGGRDTVSAFEDGDLDYAAVGDFDASWIRFDPDLGPRLRSVPALSTEYLGFDTQEPPFDDARVRRAFAQAIDWTRLVQMAGTSSTIPATSMVPPGIPGRSEQNFIPPYDPEGARALLAEAGFPDGEGFPEVTYLSGGGTVDAGFVADIERELGITIRYEGMDFGNYFGRLDTEPPDIWSLAWIADYPGANDFLGVLLASDSTNNYARWSNEAFDAAIRDAGEATDPAEARAAYDRAEALIRDEAPVIPIAYSPGWALARDGLIGATENGLGSLRLAGLAWDR